MGIRSRTGRFGECYDDPPVAATRARAQHDWLSGGRTASCPKLILCDLPIATRQWPRALSEACGSSPGLRRRCRGPRAGPRASPGHHEGACHRPAGRARGAGGGACRLRRRYLDARPAPRPPKIRCRATYSTRYASPSSTTGAVPIKSPVDEFDAEKCIVVAEPRSST